MRVHGIERRLGERQQRVITQVGAFAESTELVHEVVGELQAANQYIHPLVHELVYRLLAFGEGFVVHAPYVAGIRDAQKSFRATQNLEAPNNIVGADNFREGYSVFGEQFAFDEPLPGRDPKFSFGQLL